MKKKPLRNRVKNIFDPGEQEAIFEHGVQFLLTHTPVLRPP